MCRRRCLRKLKREHFRTRMRSVVPSARWAAGERPLGLRGQAQLMLAAFIARNFPRIVLHSPLLSGWKKTDRFVFTCYCCQNSFHSVPKVCTLFIINIQNKTKSSIHYIQSSVSHIMNLLQVASLQLCSGVYTHFGINGFFELFFFQP